MIMINLGFPCAQRQYSESLGIISHTGPLHPSYATPEARLRTFREWPPALKQRPQDLADAGFYYIGNRTKNLYFNFCSF